MDDPVDALVDGILDEAYEAAVDGLRGGDLGHHQVLGHTYPVQEDPRDPDEVLLLEMHFDEELGFEYLDRGAITFLAAAGDARAGRWGSVRAMASSG